MSPSPPSESVLPQTPVRRVVIAGGGTAGWMAAAAICKLLGRTLEVTLVESEDIGTIGVGEATIPTMLTFHRLLGIDEQAFMAASQATIKLGISFEGWRNTDHRYLHSFGITGKDHWSAGFQHFWMRGRERGLAEDYPAYCIELQAALRHRFAHLSDYRMNYAYHLDAGRYARFLRGISETHGCKRIEGRIGEVVADPGSGLIRALQLTDGRTIEGDLFVDCTGFRALLIGQTLGVGFEDWSHWLLNDSAIATQTAAVRPPAPYTRAIAEPWGWQWRIALQHRMGNGIVYASRHVDDDTARARLLSSIEGERLREPLQLRFRPGRRLQSWRGNCIALGLAASFIEPLESTTIHLIQRGIVRLLQAFPQVLAAPAIAEYNARMDEELQHVRDFVILHYHATERRDSAYWRYVAEMPLPDTLQHRIDLFRETGTVYHVPGELFAENSWIQVMLGQGIVPRHRHPVPDLMGDEELRGFLSAVRADVQRTVDALPAHHDYLQRYCPAAPA